jgi:hypothetical protein
VLTRTSQWLIVVNDAFGVTANVLSSTCAASTRSEQPVRERSRKVSWIRTLVQLVVLSVLPQVLGTLLAGPVLASEAGLYCLPRCRLDAAGPTRTGRSISSPQ